MRDQMDFQRLSDERVFGEWCHHSAILRTERPFTVFITHVSSLSSPFGRGGVGGHDAQHARITATRCCNTHFEKRLCNARATRLQHVTTFSATIASYGGLQIRNQHITSHRTHHHASCMITHHHHVMISNNMICVEP